MVDNKRVLLNFQVLTPFALSPAPVESMGKDKLIELVAAILKELQGGHIPNAETIAAMKELETNGGDSYSSVEELLARLNADD